jgi:integrase/recombinase XerD
MSETAAPLRPLPVDDWPAADLAAWQRALAPHDPLDAWCPSRRWRGSTRARVAIDYGRWLAFLQRQGALDPASGPAERVSPELLHRYRMVLRATCRDATIVMRIDGLHAALRTMQPETDWRWLGQAAQRLRMSIRDRRAKLPRLRPSRLLFELGLTLMLEADRLFQRRPLPAATRYRDGLLIALLAARPLRRANMAGLRLGSSLQRRGDGWWIALDEAETKSRRAIEVAVPDALAVPLERYLAVHRPLFLQDRQDDRLWLTRDGRWLRPAGLRTQLTRWTRRRLGVAISPQLFRDCAATSIALDDPVHVRITMHVLGHSSLRTSERYYNHAQTIDAARQWQHVARRLRRENRRPSGSR